MFPKGYLKSEYAISEAEAEEIKHRWENGMREGKTVILGKGMEFIPFGQSLLDPSIVICGHCGQWAAVQTECKHCGAMVR